MSGRLDLLKLTTIKLGLLSCAALLLLSGCGTGRYFDFWKQKQDLEQAFTREQSARLLLELAPENGYLLLGRLNMSRDPGGPLLIVAVTDKFKKQEIAVAAIMQTPLDYYQVYVPEGTYEIYFFADLDRNGYFEANEMVGRSPQPVSVRKENVRDGLSIWGQTYTLDFDNPQRASLAISIKTRQNSYVYESLDDEFFDPKYGEIGLYDPKVFMAHTQQYIFSFETVNERKTHVIFVHGSGGTPRDFKFLVEGLNRERYQPWFYFYPSGMPLKKLGANLANIIRYSSARELKKPLSIIIVAHSMGGLVGLSTLNQLSGEDAAKFIKGYISFNSPYGGIEEATAGVKHAPAVVPAWRDVAAGSEFLNEMYRGGAIRMFPSYLFFGYKTGASGDGTITLQSQLEGNVHLRAFKSYGFNATHDGILRDEQVRQVFLQALADIEGRPQGNRQQ